MRSLFLSNSPKAERDPRLLRAQLQLIVNSLFFTVFVNPIGLGMMFGPIILAPRPFGAVPLAHFWIVCGLHIMSSGAAWLIYRRRNAPFDLIRMERSLAVLQVQLALTWGITMWLLWVQGNATNNVFATLAMTSMLWAATVTRAAYMRLYMIGIVIMGSIYWLRLLTGTTVAAHVLAAVITVWFVYIVSIGISISRSVIEMLQTRFANEDMAKELSVAHDMAQIKAREAEEANHSKTAFLANMSHELRTPLNAILGFSDMIASQDLGEDVPQRYRDYAKDINNSGSHLLSLINDLLDVAKIESGHMEIDPRPLAVPEIVQTAERLMAPKFAAKRQRLVLELDPGLPTLIADERAFTQIVLNLLSNSNKFTPEDGHIRLSCRCAPEGGVLITVKDNGIGIPAAKLDTIFQPFAQADNRYDRASDGTGLGLALVRGLCELHGGRTWIESTQGAGTKVYVYFPLANAAFDANRISA
jgi:two-component system cell cycle sensor histidine kinase PleC